MVVGITIIITDYYYLIIIIRATGYLELAMGWPWVRPPPQFPMQ